MGKERRRKEVGLARPVVPRRRGTWPQEPPSTRVARPPLALRLSPHTGPPSPHLPLSGLNPHSLFIQHSLR